jgi:hypothetical protein
MAEIAEEYKSSIESISIAKEKGISFDWNGMDLSDILLAEWIENEIKGSQINSKKFSFKHKIKLKLHAWKQRLKSINKNGNYELVVFLNSQSQWATLKPVLIELVNGGSNLKVLTTKPVLLKQILQYNLDGNLLVGYHFKKFTQVEDHPMLSLINQSFPKLSYLYAAVLPYLKHPQLSYLLVGNDNTPEGRLVANMAIQKNIATGCIQHGSLNRINPLHGRSIVKHFFAFGVKPKQELEFLGKPTNEIFVKGWPLQAQFKNNVNNIATDHFFKTPTIVITFSGPGHSTTEAHHIQCIEIIKQLQEELNLSICIKLHPKDNVNYYKGFIADKTMLLTTNDLMEKGLTIHQLLKEAHIVLTGASTTALDALLCETEVVSFDLMKAYKKVDFIQDGLVHYVESKESLKQIILDILSKPKSHLDATQKKAIEEYSYQFYNDNYNPSFEIAKIINETIALKERIRCNR